MIDDTLPDSAAMKSSTISPFEYPPLSLRASSEREYARLLRHDQSCGPYASCRIDVNCVGIQKLLGEVFQPKISGDMQAVDTAGFFGFPVILNVTSRIMRDLIRQGKRRLCLKEIECQPTSLSVFGVSHVVSPELSCMFEEWVMRHHR